MLIDITLKITPQMLRSSQAEQNKALFGHMGTHFDVMNKEFPLEYTLRQGIVFDVSSVKDRDICQSDIDLCEVEKDMFVAFYSGYIEEVGYEDKRYFKEHPQLSDELIDALLEKGVSIIGLDFGGVRRTPQHIPKDQYCAERGTFVIENLCNLKAVIDSGRRFTAHTYPMSVEGASGLPCRVIAQV